MQPVPSVFTFDEILIANWSLLLTKIVNDLMLMAETLDKLN